MAAVTKKDATKLFDQWNDALDEGDVVEAWRAGKGLQRLISDYGFMPAWDKGERVEFFAWIRGRGDVTYVGGD